MANRCLLYYITDRTQFIGSESARRQRLLEKIAEAASCGVDFIQLREKDLSSRELETLAREAVKLVRKNAHAESQTQLLINSRTDVAFAVAADGVHLRSNDLSPAIAREIYAAHAWEVCIAVSCHSADEVAMAAQQGANFAVFGPVFEKRDAPGVRPTGVMELRLACGYGIPVLALGGVTLENAQECLNTGAAGIAAIRLFQENSIGEVVRQLKLA